MSDSDCSSMKRCRRRRGEAPRVWQATSRPAAASLGWSASYTRSMSRLLVNRVSTEPPMETCTS